MSQTDFPPILVTALMRLVSSHSEWQEGDNLNPLWHGGEKAEEKCEKTKTKPLSGQRKEGSEGTEKMCW